MRSTLDHLLKSWTGTAHVDPSRVGAYGMSAGAFTVLTLAGGIPRMAAIPEQCARRPEFICAALEHVKSPLVRSADGVGSFAADPRIKAVALAAPGLGFTFAGGGLDDVRVPVQMWSGERDETVPYVTNAKVIEDGLGPRVEAHRVAGATHVSFLAPCGLLKPPRVCSDPDGFDREAVHAVINKRILAFFDKHLPAKTVVVVQER